MTTSAKTLTRIPLPLAACALALLGSLACEDDATSTLPPNPAVETGLQQVLDRSVAKPDVFLPGAIAHYRSPQHAPWTGSAGLADLQAGTAMRPQDRVRAGSILKTFLATVTLQHVEEGRLSLDRKLPELLPPNVTDRIPGAGQITLRMLLDHTSGIPDWMSPAVHARVADNPSHVWSEDEIIDIAAGMPDQDPPGTVWKYSNTNYTLVGMVLDRLGVGSWRQQVRTRLLDRLGLTATLLPEPGDRRITADYARGYDRNAGAIVDLTEVDPSMAGASGGNALVTTVEDLARFLDALLDGRLFQRAETLSAMTAMRDAPDESRLPHRYGLGLESYELPGGIPVIGHSGGAAGYAVMMFRIPSRSATVVTAVNTSNLFTNAVEVFMPSVKVVAAGVTETAR